MVEAQTDTDSALAELVNMKAKIERENAELIEQREQMRQQLATIRAEKDGLRMQNSETFQGIIRTKLSNITATKKVELLEAHVDWQNGLLQDYDSQIGDQLGLTSFEEVIANLRATINGALTFYGEDSLQYELTKRTELNRNKRVELTRLTAEVDEKERCIEAKQKQIEQAQAAELKRREEEEERNRKLEEERALVAKNKQREQYMNQRSVSPQVQPFRTVSFSARSPESRHSLASGTSCVSPDDQPIKDSPAKSTSKLITGFPTFSQLTRW